MESDHTRVFVYLACQTFCNPWRVGIHQKQNKARFDRPSGKSVPESEHHRIIPRYRGRIVGSKASSLELLKGGTSGWFGTFTRIYIYIYFEVFFFRATSASRRVDRIIARTKMRHATIEVHNFFFFFRASSSIFGSFQDPSRKTVNFGEKN